MAKTGGVTSLSLSQAQSQWITHFEAVASSSSSIHCRWSIDGDYLANVRELRISFQPEYNARANLTERIDLTVTDYSILNLNSNTRYKVCLRIMTQHLSDERACVDVSTAFGFVPALIGSVVGLVSAFLILACLIGLSRYMQKRGIWVFRAPLKTADKRSPEEKSLLKKGANSPVKTASGPGATPSRPQRTPAKMVIRPEHLVEEIYCGDEDDNSQPAKPPTANAQSTTATPALSCSTNAPKSDPEVEKTVSNADAEAAPSSPAANGKIVTEALVTPECSRENTLSPSTASIDHTNASASASASASGDGVLNGIVDVDTECDKLQNAETETETDKTETERLDNEKNESVFKERVSVSVTEFELKPDANIIDMNCNSTLALQLNDKLHLQLQLQLQLDSPQVEAETRMQPEADSGPPLSPVLSPSPNYTERASLALHSTPTIATKKTSPSDFATIQMTDALPLQLPMNGNLLNSNIAVSIRPPTGIYMQFVETL